MLVKFKHRTMLSLGMAALLAMGCGDPLKPTIPAILSITTVTVGANVDFDPDGYVLMIDGTAKKFLPANATYNFLDISKGSHVLRLEGVSPNCSVASGNDQRIELTEGATSLAAFHIECIGNFGSIRVTTQTTGADQDLNGYAIMGIGLSAAVQPSTGTQVIANVRAGGTEVRIENVAANCVVDRPTQFVNVTFGATVDARFNISCVQSGSLRITTSTTGVDIDPDGYTIDVQLVGSKTTTPIRVQSTGVATVTPMLPGSYSITLKDAPPNCRSLTAAVLTVKVEGGAESQASVEVVCTLATQIAYISGFDHDAAIWLVKSNGTGQLRLTSESTDHEPAWSHDGKRIAFTSSRTDDPEVYVMDADGTNVVRLTSTEGSNYGPSWSPDGSRIAFASTRSGNAEIYSMKVDGSDTVRLTNSSPYDSNPAWSPDGKKIAFESNREGSTAIWVMNADGSAQTRITANSREDVGPAWSPDGTRIAFSRGGSSSTRDIYVVNADGTNLAQLTHGLTEAVDPSWSPDGRYIVFGALSGPCSYYYYYDQCEAVLMVASLDGIVVTLASRAPAQQPAWRP